jgi:predicted RNase H-like HicB family nuclease
VNLTIELDREVDGRWIADIPELNILLYGGSKEDAIQRAEDAAREIIADRIQRGNSTRESQRPI